jgi:hypothetical protein
MGLIPRCIRPSSQAWADIRAVKYPGPIYTAGGEYQSLNSFFKRISIAHHVSCPHAHQQNGSAKRKQAFLMAMFLINNLPSKSSIMTPL